MHLNAKTDIEAPADYVYAALIDFEGWERSAMRRGAEVRRTDKLRQIGPGATWDTAFDMRGKQRKLNVTLQEMELNAMLVFHGTATILEGEMRLELVELTPRRTRLVMNTDLKPLSLGARLFLQSIKLAKARVQAKLTQRLGQVAGDIESRYQAGRAR